MKRRLFNLLTGASLLLAVVTAALILRSYFVFDVLKLQAIESGSFGPFYVQEWFEAGRGGVGFARHVQLLSPSKDLSKFRLEIGPARHHGTYPAEYPQLSLGTGRTPHCGFQFGSNWVDNEESDSGPVHDHSLVIIFPLWVPLGIFVAGAVPGTRAWIRRRRWRATGCCLFCGYDLRGTPKRCPECGNVPGSG